LYLGNSCHYIKLRGAFDFYAPHHHFSFLIASLRGDIMTFLDRLLSSLKNERGAYMVFFAILIPILFGCAGLAVDLGNGFARHARLQKAADAAGQIP